MSQPRTCPDASRAPDRPRSAVAVTLAAVLSLTLPPAAAAQEVPAVDPADVESIEALVTALYETVNRRPGENFDWPRMRTLFLPGATLIPAVEQTGGELRTLDVDGFIAWIDENTVVGGADDLGFQEEEIAQRVERYGDIAQVFSTYQKRFWDASEILGRGINAINLIHTHGRWWITSINWDEEAGAGPLPARYLPGG